MISRCLVYTVQVRSQLTVVQSRASNRTDSSVLVLILGAKYPEVLKFGLKLEHNRQDSYWSTEMS